MEKVSVVIPVYSQWNLAKRNIDALLKFDRDFIREILVVNDCSPDANPYAFDAEIVRVIANSTNLGYTGTVNNGLRRATSDIIVLLDSDAYPIGPFIQTLLALYKTNSSIGCIGFSTVDDDGNDSGNYQYESSVVGFILGQQLKAKFSFLRFWRNKNKMPNSCAVSFRKACLDDLNYFDEENFPVLDADVDLNVRIWQSKWKLIFTSDIVVSHKGGNSYKINHKRVLLHHESRWKLLRKFEKLGSPAFVKSLLKVRVGLELLIFKSLASVKSNQNYSDKIEGRKILLKRIDLYK